jgi:hypothetical protein
MALRYLLDEHLRGGGLWQAVGQHNSFGKDSIDVVRVGDPADLPLSTQDLDILLWAEREGRILISQDKKTLAVHLSQHLSANHQSPGVFLIRPSATILQVIDYLVLASHAGDPAYFENRIEYIP